MKFSKELEAQLIPEWREAFVNYWQLKKQIKKIKLSRAPKQVSAQDGNRDLFGRSIFDPIRFLTKKLFSNNNLFDSDNKTELIQVIILAKIMFPRTYNNNSSNNNVPRTLILICLCMHLCTSIYFTFCWIINSFS